MSTQEYLKGMQDNLIAAANAKLSELVTTGAIHNLSIEQLGGIFHQLLLGNIYKFSYNKQLLLLIGDPEHPDNIIEIAKIRPGMRHVVEDGNKQDPTKDMDARRKLNDAAEIILGAIATNSQLTLKLDEI